MQRVGAEGAQVVEGVVQGLQAFLSNQVRKVVLTLTENGVVYVQNALRPCQRDPAPDLFWLLLNLKPSRKAAE